MFDTNYATIMGDTNIADLFSGEDEGNVETSQGEEGNKPSEKDNQGNDDITETETSAGNLFEGDDDDDNDEPSNQGDTPKGQSESVGNEKNKDKEDTQPDGESGDTSSNIYSSLAKALSEDGVLPNLDEDKINGANDAQSFSNLIEAEVQARLDDQQQRVIRALDDGVEPSEIRQYENQLRNLNSITEAKLNEESEQGENIRKWIMYEDFISRGYSQERAKKLVERSVESGNDLEDAAESLQNVKEHYQKKYEDLLEDAKKNADQLREKNKKMMDSIKDSLYKDKQLLGDLDIDESVRKKAFECLTKPIYKDPKTGAYKTAMQKFQEEHPEEMLKYTAIIMAITGNFKDFNTFTSGKVKKGIKNGLKEFENKLRTTGNFNGGGNMSLVTHKNENPFESNEIDPGFMAALKH